jgi:hypothetical protein
MLFQQSLQRANIEFEQQKGFEHKMFTDDREKEHRLNLE